LDPEERNGEPVELRSEAERFTNLLGGSGGGVLSGSIGVVEPACEKAIEPLEYDTAAEPGRDMGVWLDSRELDMLLDKRRIHERGRAFGVPARDALPSSRSAIRSGARSAPMLKLVLVVGVSVLFCPTLAPPEPVLPFGPSLTERAVCGVEKAKGELRLGWRKAATAVIAELEVEGIGSSEGCSVGDSSRTTASPRHAIPIPAPDAQS
jgi:Zn-finger nucleic acid-binding protein